MNHIYGYVRESENLSEDNQLLAIQEYGIDESCIYKDRRNESQAYHVLLDKIQSGDSVILASIDCLGNSYEDVIDRWENITKEHETAIVLLDMQLPDTAKALNGQFVSELVLDVLNYVEKSRREFRRQRQREGISAAQSRGVKFGRRTKMDVREFQKVKDAYERGELTVTAAADKLEISRGTFRRWIKETPEEEAVEGAGEPEVSLEEVVGAVGEEGL
ncbi:MAG: recombinase family protein [Lachnospiraceae bacterium]|nr:recombinase family protein [Lachnospiraceae bacterium]